jgi:hypothetical protein
MTCPLFIMLSQCSLIPRQEILCHLTTRLPRRTQLTRSTYPAAVAREFHRARIQPKTRKSKSPRTVAIHSKDARQDRDTRRGFENGCGMGNAPRIRLVYIL